jgi:hypothetical protein
MTRRGGIKVLRRLGVMEIKKALRVPPCGAQQGWKSFVPQSIPMFVLISRFDRDGKSNSNYQNNEQIKDRFTESIKIYFTYFYSY